MLSEMGNKGVKRRSGRCDSKRETSEKRERMIAECHIHSSSNLLLCSGAMPLEDTTDAQQPQAHHNMQDLKKGLRTRKWKRAAEDLNQSKDKKIKLWQGSRRVELKSDGEWKGGKKEKGTRCSQKPVWWVFETVTHSGTFMVANRLSCLEHRLAGSHSNSMWC